MICFVHKRLRENKLQSPFQLPLSEEEPHFRNLMKSLRDMFSSLKENDIVMFLLSKCEEHL